MPLWLCTGFGIMHKPEYLLPHNAFHSDVPVEQPPHKKPHIVRIFEQMLQLSQPQHFPRSIYCVEPPIYEFPLARNMGKQRSGNRFRSFSAAFRY